MKLVIVGDEGCLSAARGDAPPGDGDWVALPGALRAIARLNQAGWTVTLAVGFAQLASGHATMAAINALHTDMHRQVGAAGGRIDAVFFCSSDASDVDHAFADLLIDIGSRYEQPMPEIHAAFASEQELKAAARAGCIGHRIGSAGGAMVHGGTGPESAHHVDFTACAEALLSAAEAAQSSAHAVS